MPHSGKISTGGGYLYRRTTQGNVLHAGVDIGAKRGTVVVAPASGVVVAVERQNRSPFKGYDPESVVLRDDDGMYHLLAHLEPSNLADPRDPNKLAKEGSGARFEAGQPIGNVGKYNHTHWEVRTKFLKGDPMDDAKVRANTVDPLAWLKGSAGGYSLPTVTVTTPAPTSTPASKPTGGDAWIVLILLLLLDD